MCDAGVFLDTRRLHVYQYVRVVRAHVLRFTLGHTDATHPSLVILSSLSSFDTRRRKHTRAYTYRDSDKGLGCIRDDIEQAPNADRGVALSLDVLAYKREACRGGVKWKRLRERG